MKTFFTAFSAFILCFMLLSAHSMDTKNAEVSHFEASTTFDAPEAVFASFDPVNAIGCPADPDTGPMRQVIASTSGYPCLGDQPKDGRLKQKKRWADTADQSSDIALQKPDSGLEPKILQGSPQNTHCKHPAQAISSKPLGTRLCAFNTSKYLIVHFRPSTLARDKISELNSCAIDTIDSFPFCQTRSTSFNSSREKPPCPVLGNIAMSKPYDTALSPLGVQFPDRVGSGPRFRSFI